MQIGRGNTIADRYRLERPLGSGGMSVVWLATDTRLGREVAIKLLSDTLVVDSDFVQRFRREARIAAGLSHPALVPVHDLGIEEERPYLVMEYVAGETLGKRIDRAPETVDVETLATEMLGALEHIHEAGIIHRDVKPDNILYSDSGRIRLTDFGIARTTDATQITQTGQVLGTLRYMAPEIRRGADPTPASDLYSLGVVLADCARGRDTSPELIELTERLRASEPSERPVSARAARRALRGTAAPAVAAEDMPSTTATRVLDETATSTARSEEPTESRSAPPPPAAPARASAADPEPAPERSASRMRGPLLAAGLTALGAVLIAVLLIGGGSEEGGTGRDGGEQQAQSGDGGSGGESGATSTSEEPEAAPESEPPPAEPEPATEDGAALNDQGFALIQEGRPEEAVPVLERAVAALEDQPEDLTYAYALFNYGQALRMAGRPEEAIPVLEQRLTINNQRDAVRAELQRAREEANQ